MAKDGVSKDGNGENVENLAWNVALDDDALASLEPPDAVQYAMDKPGQTSEVVRVRAPVLDMTSRRDVALVAVKLTGVDVKL